MEEYISQYSRKQAIDDGDLADVTKQALAHGIKFPVATTRSVQCAINMAVSGVGGDYQSVLNSLLTVFKKEILKARNESRITFHFDLFTDGEPVIGAVDPGDDGEPVITLLYSREY